MVRLFKFFSDFMSDETGQGTVEYVLILSVSVVGATQLVRQILKVLDQGILRLGGQMEKDLKSGRAPLNVWEN
jgi:Flp pilus assembly pilin Flp